MPGGQRNDPAPAFRFEVHVEGIAAAEFATCSGLEQHTRVFEYHEGGLNDRIHKFPTVTQAPNLVLRRGLADRSLYDWYQQMLDGQLERRNGQVLVRSADGAEVLARWQFRDAFPCRWIGPELNATANEVAIEVLELCHEGLERRD